MVAAQDDLKMRAGIRAGGLVEDGMLLGLGTGSTVYHFLVELSRRIEAEGLDVAGVPTSRDTEALARRLSIPVTDLNEHPSLDMDVDGADEVDPDLNVIKGGGGAHVREKIIAKASRQLVIVVDEGKLSGALGTRCPVPVEILPMAASMVNRRISELRGSAVLRRSGEGPVVTDNGNWILDCNFGPIQEPAVLESELKAITGVVESGLFVGLTDALVIGTPGGSRIERRARGRSPEGRRKRMRR
jgi:ribose 5-phosphate isomerase A